MRLRLVQATIFSALVLILLVSFGGLFGPTAFSAAAPAGSAIPRTPEGRPDMSGIWQVMNTAEFNVEDHQAREGIPAGVGVLEGDAIPYRPEALVKRKENFANRATADPDRMLDAGCAAHNLHAVPFESCRCRNRDFYEFGYTTRYIYERNATSQGASTGMGDSRAKWESTLVSDVIDFNDVNWLTGPVIIERELHVVALYDDGPRSHQLRDARIQCH